MQWEISSLQKKKLRLSSGVPINIKYLIILFVKTVPSYSHEYIIPCWYGSSKTKATLKNICNTCRPNRLKPSPPLPSAHPPPPISILLRTRSHTHTARHLAPIKKQWVRSGHWWFVFFPYIAAPHRTMSTPTRPTPHRWQYHTRWQYIFFAKWRTRNPCPPLYIIDILKPAISTSYTPPPPMSTAPRWQCHMRCQYMCWKMYKGRNRPAHPAV